MFWVSSEEFKCIQQGVGYKDIFSSENNPNKGEQHLMMSPAAGSVPKEILYYAAILGPGLGKKQSARCLKTGGCIMTLYQMLL